jgi:hypothetical protein
MIINAHPSKCAGELSELSVASPARTGLPLCVSRVDCVRAAIASAIFEVVWTLYHASGFAVGKPLREWCIGFAIGLVITLGERAIVAMLAKRSTGNGLVGQGSSDFERRVTATKLSQ